MVLEGAPQALDALADAVRQLQAAGSVDDLLRHTVDASVATVEGCRYAGVSTDQGGRVSSPVVSDPEVLSIDALQYEIGNGPCLLAMRGPDVVVDAPDLERDPRFQPFGAEAAHHGCRAVLAHRLFVDSQTLGALNLYAEEPDAFSDDDRRRAAVLSALSSMALHMMRLELDGEGLREALRSRDVIGQAKGILMERAGLSPDEAFERLRWLSQDTNRKVRDIAHELVDHPESRT